MNPRIGKKTVLNPIHKKLHTKKTKICAEIVHVKVGKLVSKDCILCQKKYHHSRELSHPVSAHVFTLRYVFLKSLALLHQLIIDNPADAEIGCVNAPERIVLHVFSLEILKKYNFRFLFLCRGQKLHLRFYFISYISKYLFVQYERTFF
jgi:hypothetical protein